MVKKILKKYNLQPKHFIPYAGMIIYDSNLSEKNQETDSDSIGGAILLATYNVIIFGTAIASAYGLEKLVN